MASLWTTYLRTITSIRTFPMDSPTPTTDFEPPPFDVSDEEFEAYQRWLDDELESPLFSLSVPAVPTLPCFFLSLLRQQRLTRGRGRLAKACRSAQLLYHVEDGRGHVASPISARHRFHCQWIVKRIPNRLVVTLVPMEEENEEYGTEDEKRRYEYYQLTPERTRTTQSFLTKINFHITRTRTRTLGSIGARRTPFIVAP